MKLAAILATLTALSAGAATAPAGLTSLDDGELLNGHFILVPKHWNYPGQEGKLVTFTAMTDCDGARLLVNGKPFGEMQKAANPGPVNTFTWQVPYTPGLVQVHGAVNGRICIDRSVRTAGEPARVRLFPINKVGIVYKLKVFVEGKDGAKHPFDTRTVTLKVDGPGTVTPATVTLRDGVAEASVRRSGPGEIRLTGLADGLEPMVVTYGKTVPEKTDKSFTIASVNLRAMMACDATPNYWVERAPRIAEVIENRGYDIFGSQEAERPWTTRMLKLLPGWKCSYCGRYVDGEGESCTIFWNDARFELVTDGIFWLSETPDIPGSTSWKASEPRSCNWGRFRDRKTGKEFLVFNNHLDCSSFVARSEGMRILLGRVAEMRKAMNDLPAFVMGDLNISFYPGYMPIDEKHPLVMAHKVMKENWDASETPHTGPVESFRGFNKIDHAAEAANAAKPKAEQSIKGQIDHILVTEGIRVLTSGVADDTPQNLRVSDHYSLYSDVEIR